MALITLGSIYSSSSIAVTPLQPCVESVGKFASIEGTVEIQRTGNPEWHPAELNIKLCENDSIRIGKYSRAAISLINEAILRLEQNTTLRLVDITEKDEEQSILELIIGIIQSFSQQPHKFAVNTPYLNGSIEGTEFVMSTDSDKSTLIVLEGRVLAANEQGEVAVGPGQSASAEAGKAPTVSILVNPRDTVQWALYYPPVLAAFDRGGATQKTNLPAFVRESMEWVRRGQTSLALASLENTPGKERNEAFYVFRAALFLSVGRPGDANQDIDRALEMNPQSSNALALQAVIAVTQNERKKALETARKAVQSAPDSAPALIALSYAQQAEFNLKGARVSLEKAVESDPDNALAWARLAALHSAFGRLDKALEAAEKASVLAPDLSLTQTVLGFTYLMQVKTTPAREAFDKAILLNSSDPLPRLGLGLTKIREGNLEEGGREIEIAVGLDPNRSIYRSYLGKTYYEQKRSTKLVDRQYLTAEQLDPNDPTPFFYSAIEKQTTNRPVEALHDMQKAIELNDNRAVYRSKLLLDSDLASRSAATARVYSDLGFEQRALVEGWQSLNTDPSNFSAHRFLADSYSALPRHEIARVSELLQSQLLQPINTTPIQPRLAESNLFLISAGGPGALSFNEFNPLFNSNGLNFQGTGLVGSNNTYAGEGIVSGIYQKASFSVGYSHFQTDGWRENADQKDDIANAFVQFELSPQTSVQAEYRYRKTEKGDVVLRFFEDDFMPNLREEEETQTVRFGFRHSFSPDSDLIGNFSYQHADRKLRDEPDPVFRLFDLEGKDNAYGGELQYLFRSQYINVVGGTGYFYIDGKDDITTEFAPPFPPIVITSETSVDLDAQHTNVYLYTYIKPLDNLTVTVGGSGDFFSADDDLIKDKNQFNPKFGITWNPLPGTTVRGAVFRVLKRTLITDQTVEPTQVAGFNQFYDELNTTDYWVYGGAVDQKFTNNIYAGAEFTYRDLEVPFTAFTGPAPELVDVNWDEYKFRSYLFWTPHEWLALSAEWQWERLDRDKDFNLGAKDVETHYVPLAINFFHPSGFSASLIGTYINQQGSFNRTAAPLGFIEDGQDNFWLFDAAIRYRFPKRYGFLTVGVNNLFDKDFEYFDSDINNPRIQPDRSVFGSITLAFP